MNLLKLQLNTPAAYTRDMQVELTNQLSGEKKLVKPYLDGSISVPGINAGQWRVQVKHPNILFDLYDRNIQVFKDRPTLTPVVIPRNIFENVPIEDIPDADLGPVQQRLDELSAAAEGQADKLGGQPIYADDWNDLAGTVGQVARATRELTDLVSPHGHDHPEIVKKIEEIQGNLQRLYDAYGASLAQLQRQMQQLALQRKVESALDKVPEVSVEAKRQVEETARELADAWADSPAVYSARKRRTAQKLQEQLSLILVDTDPATRQEPEVKDLDEFTQAMATEKAVSSFEEEIAQQQRTGSKSKTGIVFDAFKAGRTGTL